MNVPTTATRGLFYLLEALFKAEPMLLIKLIFEARIQLQGLFSAPCPAILKLVGSDEPPTECCRPDLSVDVWRPDDQTIHGWLAVDQCSLKVVHGDPSQGVVLTNLEHSVDSYALHPVNVTPKQWSILDMKDLTWRRPVATFLEEAEETPVAWAPSVIQEAKSHFRYRYERTQVKFVCNGEGRHMASQAFDKAIGELSKAGAEAMLCLADELAIISWYFTQHIISLDQTPTENTLWTPLARACIDSMVPGLRALAFHCFGWPGYPRLYAQELLRDMQRMSTVSKAGILRLGRNLNAPRRDAIVEHLQEIGVVSVEGKVVTVVGVVDFFRKHIRSMQDATTNHSQLLRVA